MLNNLSIFYLVYLRIYYVGIIIILILLLRNLLFRKVSNLFKMLYFISGLVKDLNFIFFDFIIFFICYVILDMLENGNFLEF